MSETLHLDSKSRLMSLIDCAVVCNRISMAVGGATFQDVHLFAYLSSLIRASTGSAGSSLVEWGYGFVTTASGRPYSESIAATLDEMVDRGQLTEATNGYEVSEALKVTLIALRASESFADRIGLVDDVCSIASVRGLPKIGRSLSLDPQLRRGRSVGAVRIVEEGESAQAALELMISITDKFNGRFGSDVPALIWLDEWSDAHATQ